MPADALHDLGPDEVAAIADRDDLWRDVVGQPNAVAALQAAVRQPVHAYLFVGPAGSGRHAAARGFAAAIHGLDAARRGDDVERHIRLALEDKHPDVLRYTPEGASILIGDAREITRLASRSPVESSTKLIVLDEFHTVMQAGPALLKTIEEPPASTAFVILAESVPDEIVPIASRAVRVEFGSVPADAIEARLIQEDVDREVAAEAAVASGGDLDRARLLATDPALSARRDEWRSIPRRVDGTGHTAATLVDEVVARIDAAQEPLDAAHAAERETLEDQIDQYGLRASERKLLDQRHKRIVRRYRNSELRYGLGLLAAEYRDRLATDPDPRPASEALEAIHAAAEALIRNPNELLLLQSLVVRLPPR